jgi:predicted RNase H-like HicB family nuclease/predicted RNA binding protein YcfA (HicA-like mRNA interferase family)
MEARLLLKKLKDEGWYLGDTGGPSRQYVHPDEPGVITVCVRYTDHLSPRAVDAALIPARWEPEIEPTVAVDETPSGFSAFSPDLPGCVATGGTQAEARERMGQALTLHLAGVRAL